MALLEGRVAIVTGAGSLCPPRDDCWSRPMPTDLSMGSTPARNAAWFADTPAYLAAGRSCSHAQLYARAARLAAALAAHGIRRQDRVSMLGRNSIEFGEV